MAFLKFIDIQGVDFFMSGKMQFKSIGEYSQMEPGLCHGKDDKAEGIFCTTKYSNAQEIPIQFSIDAKRQSVEYVLCLYHLEDDINIDEIEKMFTFGDYVIKIENENEFDKRIKIGANENGHIICGRDIVYYQDKSIVDDIKIMDLLTEGIDYLAFIKRKELYEYQNEYRYLIVDELRDGQPIRFNIGNLEDIATVMTKTEFLEYVSKSEFRSCR